MTPLERLMLEAIPDGTFGGARTSRAGKQQRDLPATPPHIAAARRAELEAADRAHRNRPRPARHLAPVPDQPPAPTTRTPDTRRDTAA